MVEKDDLKNNTNDQILSGKFEGKKWGLNTQSRAEGTQLKGIKESVHKLMFKRSLG